MERVSYLYRHINHVADLKPGQTYEDHIRAVHAKYEAKSKGKEAPPLAHAAPPLQGVNETTPAFRVVKADGFGWFDVVDRDNKPLTEKSMRRAEAEAMAAEKNG